jgi:hypothetical protein
LIWRAAKSREPERLPLLPRLFEILVARVNLPPEKPERREAAPAWERVQQARPKFELC